MFANKTLAFQLSVCLCPSMDHEGCATRSRCGSLGKSIKLQARQEGHGSPVEVLPRGRVNVDEEVRNPIHRPAALLGIHQQSRRLDLATSLTTGALDERLFRVDETKTAMGWELPVLRQSVGILALRWAKRKAMR